MKNSGCSILVAALIILALATCAVQGATLVVAPSGGDFGDVQPAVTAASAGDVIEIRPGQYPGEVVVDRPLTLAGTGEGCRIGTADDHTALLIRADNVTVRNLTFAASSTGISLEGAYNTVVEGCKVGTAETGIRIAPANGTIIRDSAISSETTGIDVSSSSAILLEANRISALSRGISIDGGEGCMISGNRLTACEIGIFTEGLRQSTMRENTFSGNVGGAVFINARDCRIEDPVITDVTQFAQFIASSGCMVTIDSLNGPDYFVVDILSDTAYIAGPYAVSGWNYALMGETYEVPEGYLQFGDPFRFTIMEDAQSETDPFIVMEAEVAVEDLEGYDPETFGFYRIDGEQPALVGDAPVAGDGMITASAAASVPGSYALLVQTQTTGPDLFYVVMGIIAAIVVLLIYLVFVWRRD